MGGKPPRRAREGELDRRSKRSWPGPRLGAPFLRVPRPRRAILVYTPDRARGARASRAGLRPARPHCGQEGDNLRFSPSTRYLRVPSGRAARVKALSRQTAATHLLLQHEGDWTPPRRGAQCAPILSGQLPALGMTPQSRPAAVPAPLKGEPGWRVPPRRGACSPICSCGCKQMLSPICGETHRSESNHTHPARAVMRSASPIPLARAARDAWATIRLFRRKHKEKTAFQSENGPFCILL